MTDQEIKENLAAIRERMVVALAGDDDALKILSCTFPEDWGDAPGAVVWMLGNAARFATDTNGMGCEFAQAWLDRLVNSDGEPIE